MLSELNFEGIKEDVVFYLGRFGGCGSKDFDGYVWNGNSEDYEKIEELKDIGKGKMREK